MTDTRNLNGCEESITRRLDAHPDEGHRVFGDVAFAEPVNNTYPLDTREHIAAGSRDFHQE